MAITYTMKKRKDGSDDPDNLQQTRTISERKRLAKIPDDLEIERDILEARQNKKAQQDAGMDMLLDAVKKKTKPKKGKV